jgi:hypothetical protein
MHTKVIQSKEFGEIRVHYNSDFSGLALISWSDAPEYISCLFDSRESQVPAELLRPLIADIPEEDCTMCEFFTALYPAVRFKFCPQCGRRLSNEHQ